MGINKNVHEPSFLQANKIRAGERQIAVLLARTGFTKIRHCVDQDSTTYLKVDSSWIAEILDCPNISRSMLKNRWSRAAERTNLMREENSAEVMQKVPVMFYKRGRFWRAVWPLHFDVTQLHGVTSQSYEDTVESSPDAWAFMMKMALAEMVNPTLRSFRNELTNYFFRTAPYEPVEDFEEDDPR